MSHDDILSQIELDGKRFGHINLHLKSRMDRLEDVLETRHLRLINDIGNARPAK